MSQAIHTKFLKGGRIKATAARGSLIMHYDQASTAHEVAARALCDKFIKQDKEPKESNPWNRPFVTGDLPNGDKVHVFAFDLKALFDGPDELLEAIGHAIAKEFALWKRAGGYVLPGHTEPFSPRGIACRAARIFLEPNL